VEPLTDALSSAELDTVRRSLQAAVEGNFFPDWEFQTLIGVDRATVQDVYNAWPRQNLDLEDFSCAVVGSLANLLWYPHGRHEELISYVTEGPEAIEAALDRLTALGL
jgi:hypothetical protein